MSMKSLRRGIAFGAAAYPVSSINSLGHERELGSVKRALRDLLSNPTTTPDLSACSRLLQICIDFYLREDGKYLHDRLVTLNYPPSVSLSTKFVIFYCRIGDVESARQIFDEMCQRSIVSWTAMISGYSQNGRHLESLKVFSEMKKLGSDSNEFTYGSVIRACVELRCVRAGRQIHGCIAKCGFQRDLIVQTALVDLYLKCGLFEDADYLFWEMEHKDLISWNALIGGLAAQGQSYESFRVFQLMLQDGVLPDDFTFGSIFKACAGVRYLQNTIQFHCFVLKLGHLENSVVIGSLIDAYGKCRCLSTARSLYDAMPEKDLVSCSSLITAFSMEKKFTRTALDLFYDIAHKRKLDAVISCSMLTVCANAALLFLGRQIHASVLKNQPKIDLALSNALIDMYAKAGDIEDAFLAFGDTEHKNVISWTSLIAGYGRHGRGEDAISAFTKMEEGGFKPNDVTFLTLLSSCSHSGLTEQGISYFCYMVEKYRINPRTEHYACLVDLLARGGLIQTAYETICEMGVEPDRSIWGSLLGASRVYLNLSLGVCSAGYLCNLDPERYVNYVVLANIYASSGLWEDAWKIRRFMEGRNVKKDRGSSFVHLQI